MGSCSGETMAELLVSVLVIVLGLTMFATAMMSAKKMLTQGDQVMQAYYSGRNILEEETEKTGQGGTLILEQDNSKKYFSLPSDKKEAGKYSVDLYSEKKSTAAGGTSGENQAGPEYYRYSRKK